MRILLGAPRPRFGMRSRHILCPILRSGLAIGEEMAARHEQRERPSPLGLTRAFLASMNFFHPATRAPDPDKVAGLPCVELSFTVLAGGTDLAEVEPKGFRLCEARHNVLRACGLRL